MIMAAQITRFGVRNQVGQSDQNATQSGGSGALMASVL
jgi:hypothetical protein